MPNIRSQTVFNDEGLMALQIVGSDGRIFNLTKAEVIAFYQSTSGNAASRRNQVITWAKNGIVSALGAETIAVLDIDIDFDTATGRISRSTLT